MAKLVLCFLSSTDFNTKLVPRSLLFQIMYIIGYVTIKNSSQLENSVIFLEIIIPEIIMVDTCKTALTTIGIVALRTMVLDIMTETKLRVII